jgi:hypothetical protein
MPLLLQPSINGVRLRQAPINGTPVAQLGQAEVLESLEADDVTQQKLHLKDAWINVRSAARGISGFMASQFLVLSPQNGIAPATPVAPTPVAPTPVAPTPATAPVVGDKGGSPTASATGGKFAPDDEARVRTVAFGITAAWEGSGYAAYQNYDKGIISYGRFQFTLMSRLVTVVNQYLAQSQTPVANELRTNYHARINARDVSLAPDTRLRDLLVAAAAEPIMQQVQDEEARAGFWQPALELSALPRGLRLPLSWAMTFDMGINHGLRHIYFGDAETALGVTPRTSITQNGLSEERLIAEVARQRHEKMTRFADKNGFGGLKLRTQFWIDLIARGDFYLQGVDGVIVVNGRRIATR